MFRVFIKAATFLDKIMGQITHVAKYIGAFGVLLIVILITVDVISRYFFHSAMPWLYELSGPIFLYSVFLLIPWLTREGLFITVDVILSRLEPRKKSLLNCATFALSILGCCLFLYKSSVLTWEEYGRGVQTIGSLIYPHFLISMAIPIGLILTLWNTTGRFLFYCREFTSLKESRIVG